MTRPTMPLALLPCLVLGLTNGCVIVADDDVGTVDCSRAGAALPPLCGAPCQATCGCGTCTEGQVFGTAESSSLVCTADGCLVEERLADGGGDGGPRRRDGGASDGGPLDGGESDGGSRGDGAAMDAGVTDGGAMDAGVTDGGNLDGAAMDGGDGDGEVVDGARADGGDLDGSSDGG